MFLLDEDGFQKCLNKSILVKKGGSINALYAVGKSAPICPDIGKDVYVYNHNDQKGEPFDVVVRRAVGGYCLSLNVSDTYKYNDYRTIMFKRFRDESISFEDCAI